MFIAYGDPYMCGDEAVVSFFATERIIILMNCWSHSKVIYFV